MPLRWQALPVLVLLCAWAAGANGAPRLPARLAGWQVTAVSQPAPNAAPVLAAMREFGLLGRQSAVLAHDSQRLQLEAWQFADASGGFGAFTYWRPAASQRVRYSSLAQAAFAPNEAWAWRDHWLIHVAPAPSVAALRALLAALPAIQQGSHALPQLPQFLPPGQLPGSLAYAEGPAALAHAAPWLPAAAVGFTEDAEVVVASYPAGAATGQLALIGYPTPQIAAARLQELRAAGLGASRRSGALLILWHGPATAASARLLGAPRQSWVVSWTRPLGLEGLPGLILGIFALVGLIILVSLAVGLATGGLRVLLAKLFPHRFPLYSSATRYTRLNLR